MIEKLINLFERFVVAVEDIADTLARQEIVHASPTVAAPAETTEPAKPDYETMDRDTLVALCEQRDIEVPPRTRTETLVKKLNSWDAVQAATPPTEPAPEENLDHLEGENVDVEGDGGNDAFPPDTEPDPEPEADPFGQDEPEEAPAAELTHEAVLQALQDYRKNVADKGGDGIKAVTNLISTHAGVTLVREIPAEKRKAILDAIREAA